MNFASSLLTGHRNADVWSGRVLITSWVCTLLYMTNVHHFKYFEVMQSGDGDTLTAVYYRVAIAWSDVLTSNASLHPIGY